MDDNQAKIREALDDALAFAIGYNIKPLEESVRDALALLDTEDKPSVPMAMLEEISKVTTSRPPFNSSTMLLPEDYREIAARYGFQIKE